MKLFRTLSLLIVIVGASWYALRFFTPLFVNKDFDAICAAYEKGMAKIKFEEGRTEEPDRAQIAVDVATEIEKNIVNRDVISIATAINIAAPDSRYLLLKQTAVELGLPNWECEPARLYLEPK